MHVAQSLKLILVLAIDLFILLPALAGILGTLIASIGEDLLLALTGNNHAIGDLIAVEVVSAFAHTSSFAGVTGWVSLKKDGLGPSLSKPAPLTVIKTFYNIYVAIYALSPFLMIMDLR